jgi:hypothetical protein
MTGGHVTLRIRPPTKVFLEALSFAPRSCVRLPGFVVRSVILLGRRWPEQPSGRMRYSVTWKASKGTQRALFGIRTMPPVERSLYVAVNRFVLLCL